MATATGQRVIDGYLEPAGYTQITSLSSAATLGTIPAESKIAIIQAESQNIRWRDTGVNPTASVGMILLAGESLVYNGDLTLFRAIEVTASAKINVSFYK